MDIENHVPRIQKDLKYNNISRNFWCGFGTYMDKYETNQISINIFQANNPSAKYVMKFSKVSETSWKKK